MRIVGTCKCERKTAEEPPQGPIVRSGSCEEWIDLEGLPAPTIRTSVSARTSMSDCGDPMSVELKMHQSWNEEPWDWEAIWKQVLLVSNMSDSTEAQKFGSEKIWPRSEWNVE
jgi:hypothetical protein